MQIIIFLVFILIGTFTGWLVMSIGLWFIFKGIVPRKKAALSKYIAGSISFDEIEQKLVSPESFKKIEPSIEAHIDNFLTHKLSKSMPMLSMFIGDKTIAQLKKVFMEELEDLFPTVMKN